MGHAEGGVMYAFSYRFYREYPDTWNMPLLWQRHPASLNVHRAKTAQYTRFFMRRNYSRRFDIDRSRP